MFEIKGKMLGMTLEEKQVILIEQLKASGR